MRDRINVAVDWWSTASGPRKVEKNESIVLVSSKAKPPQQQEEKRSFHLRKKTCTMFNVKIIIIPTVAA